MKWIRYFLFIYISMFLPIIVHADFNYNAFDFTFDSIDKGKIDLSHFKGNLILIVNTSSHSGFTRQYDDLEELWKTYREKKLIIIAIPSNSFQDKETLNNKQLAELCKSTFKITFPITAKTNVIGNNAHPFFKWIAAKAGEQAIPKWNFYKYLISKDGELINWYSSEILPLSRTITHDIAANLPK